MLKSELNPLVSVTVLTYNSAKFVLETLESIKAQTYQYIELIVSDDCSTDNSVEICKNWIEENKNRFVETHLITSPVNTGIPANKNRALAKCKGEWIKGIAADDLLVSICIEEFIKFTCLTPDANIIASKQLSFKEENGIKTYFGINPVMNHYNHTFYMSNCTVEEQYNLLLLRKVSIAGPTYFVKKKLLSSINYFDEKYRLLEDYPMFLRVLELGNYIYFLDIVTVNYRQHNQSVSYHGTKKKVYPDFFYDWYKFLMHYNFKRINLIYKMDLLIEVIVFRIVISLGNRGSFSRALWRNRRKILPSRYFRFFRIIK